MASLEQFARVRAAIERGEARDRVLRDEGLTPSSWIDLQRRFLDAIASEIAMGRDTLATRYCAAFDAAISPPKKEEAPRVVDVVEVEAPSPAVNVPSYLKAHSTPVAAAPQHDLKSTAMMFDVPRGPATPFTTAAPQAIPAASPEPKPAPRISTGTSMSLGTPTSPATPFHPSTTTKPGASTAWSSSAPSGPATPFAALPPEAMGFDLTRYAELMAARSEPGRDLASVLAEIGIDHDTLTRVEAYWNRKFTENALLALQLGPLLEQAARARREKQKNAASPAPVNLGTGTVTFDPPQATMPAEHDTNDHIAGAPHLSNLSVEQYAFVVASLRKATDIPAVLARFRLTPETRKELEARWAARMGSDPELREKFLATLGRYLARSAG